MRAASRTAVGVATLRAAHQLLDGLPRILDDPIAIRVLGPEAAAGISAHAEAFQRPRVLALRSHVLLRSRFAEDRLAAAVTQGVVQYVILGAGLDTFAYRQPDWASRLTIFEVDHPGTQAEKRDRLARGGLALPPNLVFAAIDFEHERLADGLVRHGLDTTKPVFLSCLGVIVYLPMDAVFDLFRFVATLAPGSECAFTFGGKSDGDPAAGRSLGDLAADVGEPFQSPLDLDETRAVLHAAGLGDPIVLTTAEAARYLGDRTDGLPVPRHERIASVVVRET